MWTRKELKEKAKMSFKANYWKAVLIGLLISIIASGTSMEYRTGGRGARDNNQYQEQQIQTDDNKIVGALEKAKPFLPYNRLSEDMNNVIDSYTNNYNKASDSARFAPAFAVIIVVVTFMVFVIGFIIKAFILNPLELGGRKFFLKNLNEKAELDLVIDGFKYEYMNGVKTMFFRDLYVFLWGLLFIIPGIVKSYEYRMVKYIIAENPTLSTKEALSKSKDMMKGNKWDTFVLDLSFILWHILSGITSSLVGIFYVYPYVAQTDAALYEALRKDEYTTSYSSYVEVE